ncbi:MAG: hypothetical protein ABWW69_05090 [Pyrodictiaceae archaeon]
MPTKQARIRIYIHPLSIACYNIVKTLEAESLLDRVVIVNTSVVGASGIIRHGVWSVPWITVDGKPLATEPIPVDEVIDIIVYGRAHEVHDPVEAFINTIVASTLASAIAFLHGSLYPVLDKALAMAAVREPLTGIDTDKLLEEVRSREREIYSDAEEKLVRSLAIAFMSDIWWIVRGKCSEIEGLVRDEVVALWLIAKASIGRLGLPPRPSISMERIGMLRAFIEDNLKGLCNRVVKDYETILSDEEYWRLLAAYAR